MPSTKYSPIPASSKQPEPLNPATSFRLLHYFIVVGALTFLSWAGIMAYVEFYHILPENCALTLTLIVVPLTILGGIGALVLLIGTALGLTKLCRMHPEWIPAWFRVEWEHYNIDEELGDLDAEQYAEKIAKEPAVIQVISCMMKMFFDEEYFSRVKAIHAEEILTGEDDIDRITEKFGDWVESGSVDGKNLIWEKSM